MSPDAFEDVAVRRDAKVKALAAVDPGLPNVAVLVVLLGAEPWMLEITQKQAELLEETPLNVDWRCEKLLNERFRQNGAHAPVT